MVMFLFNCVEMSFILFCITNGKEPLYILLIYYFAMAFMDIYPLIYCSNSNMIFAI